MDPGTAADGHAGTTHSVIGEATGAAVHACGLSIAQENRAAGQPLKRGRHHGGPCKFVVAAEPPTRDGPQEIYPDMTPKMESSHHWWSVLSIPGQSTAGRYR